MIDFLATLSEVTSVILGFAILAQTLVLKSRSQFRIFGAYCTAVWIILTALPAILFLQYFDATLVFRWSAAWFFSMNLFGWYLNTKLITMKTRISRRNAWIPILLMEGALWISAILAILGVSPAILLSVTLLICLTQSLFLLLLELLDPDGVEENRSTPQSS